MCEGTFISIENYLIPMITGVINQIILEINLEVKNLSLFKKYKPVKKKKKLKEKIFSKNLGPITLPQKNLKNYHEDGSYYKFVGKSILQMSIAKPEKMTLEK